MRPQISVVVPTYQRAALLDRCLGALVQSDARSFEVVVVDDGSTDRTADVVSSYRERLPLRSVVQARNLGPAAARNAGVRTAEADLLLFLDDDVVVTPTLLSTHLRHAAPDLCVLGRVVWDPSLVVTPFMRWLDSSGLQFGYETWLREGPVDPPYAAFYTANLSIPKRWVVEAGGFDERFRHPAYEDMELAYRLTGSGLRMHYQPEALAYHARPIDLPTFRRRMAMVARSAAVLRETAPGFPLDDTDLVSRHVRRRDRWLLGLRAALLRSPEARSRHYWAQVAHAYVRAS